VNIQKLVSLVKNARKRRQIFLFHDNPRSGIDVPEEDWTYVISLVIDLFKLYKAQGCNIEVTWWGEIFISLPSLETPFEISINHKPNHIKVNDVIKNIKGSGFARIGNLDFATSLSLSVRPIRKKTKWHTLAIDTNDTDSSFIAVKMHENIHPKISSYYKEDNELDKIRKISKEDLIAVIRMGGVLLGRNSMLNYLAADLNRCIYISKLTISDSTITIDAGRLYEESVHHFGKKELKIFLQYLPEHIVLGESLII
jgi:hypothetical protein